MRDYNELLTVLRACTSKDVGCMKCPRLSTKSFANDCAMSAVRDAADAIEELLAAEPPLLWTDEPIEGTEFMTHSQGGRKGFEIHFRTDSLEKYKAVQEECRRQIDHAKPDPPKEVV